MRKTSLRFVVASCALCTVPMVAHAQVGQTQQVQPLPPGGQVITPGQPIQPGQVRPGQPLPGTVQPVPGSTQTIRDGEQTLGNQTYESRREPIGDTAQQGGSNIQNFLVTKLMLCNRAEIELGQMAMDKAQNDDVKSYAEKLVNDHRQLSEKLRQFQSGMRGPQGQTIQRQGNQGQVRGQQGQQTQGQLGSQPQPGQIQPGQPGQPGQTQPGQPGQLGRTTDRADVRDQAQGQPGQMQQGQGRQVPQQLTSIVQKTADTQLQMAKEMLQEQQGQDFDMAYLGLQVVSHANTLAELRAIESIGSQEFQQLVKTAEEKVSGHLEQAKSLAKKLKDEKKG